MLLEVDDADLGPVLQHNVMWRMSESPGRIRFTGRRPGARTPTRCSPSSGYDADEISRAEEERGRPMSTTPLLEAPCQAGGARSSTWAASCGSGMPQSPNHPQFWHTLPRRHGDMVRADGGSAANDMISMGTHVGTHIDALAHVSHDGKMYGGVDAVAAGIGGKYDELGVHTIAPMVRRGVLLDVPATRGVDALRGRLRDHRRRPRGAPRSGRDAEVGEGDVVLVRSGWGRLFADGCAPTSAGRPACPASARPAPSGWPSAACTPSGADTIAFERLAPRGGHALLPAHRVLLVEHGIYIIEAMDLEALAAPGAHEFTFVLVPLNIYGATGSPVRPLAAGAGVSARRRADPGRAARRDSPPRRPTTTSPTEVVESVEERVLDTLGIAVAAAPLETSRAARRLGAEQGGQPSTPRRSASRSACPANLAAFVNGVLAHSLDYDDTHLPSVLHPSASRRAGGAGRRRARRGRRDAS